MSGNHNGDLNRALAIVDAVAESGAHALKLQTYRPDTITIDVDTPAFRISGGHELWGGQNLYRLYERAHTPYEWHGPIFERARERGLTVFSSPSTPPLSSCWKGWTRPHTRSPPRSWSTCR